jgi:hypothetical protein
VESIAWAQYATGLALLGYGPGIAAAEQFYASAAFWGKVAAGAALGAIGFGVAAGRVAAAGSGEIGPNAPRALAGGDREAQGQPVTMNVYITAGAVDEKTIDNLLNQMRDRFGKLLENSGGRMGNVVVQTKRI